MGWWSVANDFRDFCGLWFLQIVFLINPLWQWITNKVGNLHELLDETINVAGNFLGDNYGFWHSTKEKESIVERMPYVLKQVKNGYYVVNKETGKKYSNKPMTKENAEGQLRLLQSFSRKKE